MLRQVHSSAATVEVCMCVYVCVCVCVASRAPAELGTHLGNAGVGVGPRLQQQPRRLQAPVLGRHEEGRVAALGAGRGVARLKVFGNRSGGGPVWK